MKNSSRHTVILAIGICAAISLQAAGNPSSARADSVNSPNITLNVDTNRSSGPGAGNVSVAIGTITLAETMVTEYSSGTTRKFTLQVRRGFQFDKTSNITAQSATFGINGSAVNVAASVTPTGTANEIVTFNLTSGGTANQDIIKVNGVKLRILDAAGAAGPAQTTILLTTATCGGAFTDQGIVAASITKGAADHLSFSAQPATNMAGADLLPAVKMVDFGGNVLTADARSIALNLQTNPGSATLLGTTTHQTASGIATWLSADHLSITTAASGYVIRATHSGAAFLSADSVDSQPFDITAGPPGQLVFSTQPVDTVAGANILLAVTAQDSFGNPITATSVPVTIDLAVNPGGGELLATTTLTKNTVNGVATWDAQDELRITTAATGFSIGASGIAAPVASNPFAITAGSPAFVRFVQGPTDVAPGAIMTPPVTAEVLDPFANRTSFGGTVQLALLTAPCGGSISGTSTVAVQGLASFTSVSLDKACVGDVIRAFAPGLGYASSARFDVAVESPIAARLVQLKPGKLFHLVAKGQITLPNRKTDNPTKKGASLVITGTTGSVTYSLGKRGWSGLGPRGNGSKGFQFRGARCQSLTLKKNDIEVSCKGRTGTLALPESGPLEIVLAIGGGTTRYCVECGGTISGQPDKLFQRVNCTAPAACP